jgi:hypothetical protein
MHSMGASDASLFFQHFATLGYGIAFTELNPLDGCCAELLLLKVADWRGTPV